MMEFRDNFQKCQEYIDALEEEKRKIQVFQRELPLCLELVTQAIETCKQQLSGAATTECLNGHSECSGQTSSDGPVFEDFIPLKGVNSTDNDDDLESNKTQINKALNNNNDNDKSGTKSDWLRSVQLWSQTPDPPTTQEDHQPAKKVSVVEVKKNNGGAFHPFQKEKGSGSNKPTSAPAASACSTATAATASGGTAGGSAKKEEKGRQSQRKSRRCWSPELHKRFLHALQQLGGSHAATPKQIRELMKVDGLTNDEVKSHLQKYRLHTRRPSLVAQNNANPQAPQFVVVGGIWVPPPEYAAVAAPRATSEETTTALAAPTGSIYAPVASVPAPPPPLSQPLMVVQEHDKHSSHSHCNEKGSQSDGGVHSNSPSTSSSTHTTTASHAY